MRINKKASLPKMSTKEKTPPPKNEVSRFCDGSFVEVTSKEDGYEGVWFEAQIVIQLLSPAIRGRKRKKGGSFIVQYLKFVEENGCRALTETVEGQRLRPLPPDVDEPIGVYDVVDALLNDGWWEGVVIEVLDESNRFSVFFETPSPHVMEFGRDSLRHHMNWVDGNWFRSSKKTNNSYVQDDQRQNQLAISTSTELFANSEGGIILSQGCKKLKTKGTYTPSTSAKLLSDMQPSISFRASLLGNIFENASDAQQSRPTTCLKIVDLGSRDEDISAGNVDVTPQHPNNSGILIGKETADFSSWEAYSIKGNQNAFQAKALEAFQKPGVLDERNREMRSSPSNSSESNFIIRELDLPDITNEIVYSLLQCVSMDETAGTSAGIMVQAQASKFDGITYPEIAKEPIDIVVSGGKEKTSLLSLENSSLTALPSSKNSSVVEVFESSRKGYLMKDGRPEIMTVTSCSTSSNPPPFPDIVELDHLDTISDPLILQQRNETVGSLVHTNDQILPFRKKSPLWKHIELMEAFHAFPQNPHFHPLEQYKDSYREAMAIACMVMFAGLVEEMLELVADIPKSNIDKIMKDILPLENHGFNVAPIEDCLTKLQRVKEEREQLLQASVESKSKIMEQAHAMAETLAKLENAVKEMREFEENVSKLKEEVAKLGATEEEQVSEMIARRSKDDSIDQGLLQNGIHFQNILLTSNRHN